MIRPRSKHTSNSDRYCQQIGEEKTSSSINPRPGPYTTHRRGRERSCWEERSKDPELHSPLLTNKNGRRT
ncbi:hypothetical protein ACOSP7_013476 [Xanthoceras sorbifolium]